MLLYKLKTMCVDDLLPEMYYNWGVVRPQIGAKPKPVFLASSSQDPGVDPSNIIVGFSMKELKTYQ